jgi:hypothetical protein
VDDEVKAAALRDAPHRDHVIPLVDHFSDLKRGEENLDMRNVIITDDIIVAHANREPRADDLADNPVELLTPTRMH